MRKIKNAIDNTTGELIYIQNHAKATFMSDGSTVEDAINNIGSKIDLSDYVKSEELGGYAKIDEIPSLYGYATEQWVNGQGFLKEHQDISHLAETSELPTKTSDLTNDSGFITINDVPEVTAETGDNNGQIKINGTNVTVKGLADAAYKAVDTTVSSGSTNLITSGGVYTGLTSISINSVTAGTSTTIKPGVLNKVSGTYVPCVFNFEKADTSTVAYEYIILFETGNGNTPWVFSTASGVKWSDETVFIAESVNNANSGGAMATFGANKKIQVSVLGGIAIACVVS